jgi:hypothetical protein
MSILLAGTTTDPDIMDNPYLENRISVRDITRYKTYISGNAENWKKINNNIDPQARKYLYLLS